MYKKRQIDIKNQGFLSFDKFKQVIDDLYYKEKTSKKLSHIVMRSAFDFIDIRKDGVIDQNEWLKTFEIAQVTQI